MKLPNPMRPILLPLIAAMLAASVAFAQRPTPDHKDLVYAAVDAQNLLLDIYLPKNTPKPYPVVVWIHGGGWQSGSKDNPNGTQMLTEGFALVSINYRLSGQAIFPAQIHDCKAAIRWIRANAALYGFDPARIGVFGSSAGGHLVALLGTSGDVASLEGAVGGNLDYSSRVQAVCDWYGPSNLVTMGDYPSSLDHRGATSPEGRLIGGAILDNRDKALAASPVTYATQDDPPFLIQHGTEDMTVPFHQSVEMDSALRAVRSDVTFIPIVGGTHGGGFQADTVRSAVTDFFNRVLKKSSGVGSERSGSATVVIAPNPVGAESVLSADLPSPTAITVQLFDALGRVVAVRPLGVLAAGPHVLPMAELFPALGSLSAGAYTVRVQGLGAPGIVRVALVR